MFKKNRVTPFESCIRPHMAAAYNLARWLTHKDSDAEDVLQESLFRAFRYYDDLNGESIRPWFLQIVRNSCYTWLKKNRNFVELVDEDALTSDNETPEELLLRKVTGQELRVGLESLSVEYREVLILREIEEYSYREISQILGVNEGTVMSRLSRARAKLREFLGQRKGAAK